MTTIKQSLIKDAGYGVFTTRKYKKGDFVCFYDCEEKEIGSITDFTYSIKLPFNKKNYVGFSKLRTQDGTGQFINDYSMFHLNEDDRNDEGLFKIHSPSINEKIKQYINTSNSYSNVGFSTDITKTFELYAIRDINENEELYLHYGLNYWTTNIQLKTDEPFTQLYCLLKNKALTIKKKQIYLDDEIITPEYILQLLRIHPTGGIINHLSLGNHTNFKKVKYLIELLM